ncbi:MAG: hypothetical protein FWG22_03235 [Prolixibacteraceae bacterium]|nr:hypothetical protein [Prolixibacteraceae bacterium]
MRKLLFIMMMLIVLPAMAQKELTVTVSEKHSSKGKVPGFEVEIPQTTTKDATNLLEKTLVNSKVVISFKKKPKLVKEKDEWVMRGVIVDRITTDSLNVFAQVASFADRSLVTLFFETPKGFIGGKEDEAKIIDATKDYVRDYAVIVYRDAVEKELKNEENKLKSFQNDLSRAEKQESSINKQISDLKSNIASAKGLIKENETLIEQNKSAIKLDESATAKKELEAKISAQKKEITKQNKQASQYEKKISQLEKKIIGGQSEQKTIKTHIERQEATVTDVRTKLSGIR